MNGTNESNYASIALLDDGWALVPVFMAYIIEGVIVGGTNLFIVIIVLYFKALRGAKEYLVIMSLSLADGCNMFAYIIAGNIRQIYLSVGPCQVSHSGWRVNPNIYRNFHI